MGRRSASPGRQVAKSPALKFEQRLVLHQWLLGLCGVSSFKDLTENLKGPGVGGLR
jgi:hypothetical protein